MSIPCLVLRVDNPRYVHNPDIQTDKKIQLFQCFSKKLTIVNDKLHSYFGLMFVNFLDVLITSKSTLQLLRPKPHILPLNRHTLITITGILQLPLFHRKLTLNPLFLQSLF